MSRRRPLQHSMPPQGGYDATPNEPRPLATSLGSAIEPFLVGGGRTFWETSEFPPGTPVLAPRASGYQLLAAFWVPPGRVGFVKRVVAAPTVPSVIGDAFRNGLSWWESDNWPVNGYPGGGSRANSAGGLWTTPLAWEGFFPLTSEPRPSWRWQAKILPGNFAALRQKATGGRPFDATDPSTWYLVSDIPLTRTASTTIPGSGIGAVGAQRFPALPDASLNTHWLVPQNNSILLWSWWDQRPLTINAGGPNGPSELMEDVYPIGPSVGQLSGYTQAIQSPAALDNAEVGWGG